MTTFNLDERVPRIGSDIEVRSRFDGRWVTGFKIAAADDGCYLIRRVSDGTVLPEPFLAQDVRPLPAA
jgi:hypothetical protein